MGLVHKSLCVLSREMLCMAFGRNKKEQEEKFLVMINIKINAFFISPISLFFRSNQ